MNPLSAGASAAMGRLKASHIFVLPKVVRAYEIDWHTWADCVAVCHHDFSVIKKFLKPM